LVVVVLVELSLQLVLVAEEQVDILLVGLTFQIL
jgi:hypothetical protein